MIVRALVRVIARTNASEQLPGFPRLSLRPCKNVLKVISGSQLLRATVRRGNTPLIVSAGSYHFPSRIIQLPERYFCENGQNRVILGPKCRHRSKYGEISQKILSQKFLNYFSFHDCIFRTSPNITQFNTI